MPVMDGLELRKSIDENEYLRRKSIPFVFLTTTAGGSAVKAAFDMSVQGFFEKGSSMQEIGTMIRLIYDYWQLCRHPNN
jgi:DNA-binding NarL/FixJ family response regulator